MLVYKSKIIKPCSFSARYRNDCKKGGACSWHNQILIYGTTEIKHCTFCSKR